MASEGEAGSAAATEAEPGEGYGSFVYFTALSVMIWRKKHFHSPAKRDQHANLSTPQSNQANLI